MSDQSATPRRGAGGDQSQAEQLLRRAIDVIEAARPMPLSSDSRINKEEVLELLNESVDRLPDELRSARWLLKEREDYLGKVRREGEEILDQARSRAERMVQRTEVVKASEARARKIVDAAQAEANRLKNECEDYCDHKLASFEIVLERTLKMVGAGRDKLQGTVKAAAAASGAATQADDLDDGPAVFDQDLG